MILASPGQAVDLYLEISRNNEPLDSETPPVVTGLWFDGANLLSGPRPMAQIETGLYFASVILDSTTALGDYQAEMRFTRLGIERREIQTIQVVPDPQQTVAILEGLLPENTSQEYVIALADNAEQKAAAGRVLQVNYSHKRTAQPDYSAPVVSGTRKFYYGGLGDLNPERVG